MAGEWREVALGDVAEEITVGHVGPMASEYVEAGVPFLRSQNVEPLRINTTDLRYISREFHKKLSKSRLSPGDVVIVRTGKPGACAVIPEWLHEANCSDLVIVRCGAAIDSRYLAYYVNSAASHHVASYLVGAVQQHFNVGSARMLRIALPPLTEQQAIACILGSLDDKIELNRQMNRTLEEMARAIFKSWFIDFDPVRAKAAVRRQHPKWTDDQISRAACPNLKPELARLFPDSFEDSELGEIPMGWPSKTLTVLARLNPENWSRDTAPEHISYVDLANTKWGRIESTALYRWEDAPSRAQRVLRPGDTIVGTVRPGNGSFALISTSGLTGSTGFAVLRPVKPEFEEFVYLAATAPENIDRLAHLADGAAYPAVRPEAVLATPIVRPADSVIRVFSRTTKPLMTKIAENAHQSRTLAALRDTLLPRLISGRLRVPDAERIVKRKV